MFLFATTRQDKTRQDKTRQDKTRQDKPCRHEEHQDMKRDRTRKKEQVKKIEGGAKFAHPGGYYGVLRSTRVVPVIFRRQISNVARVKYKN